MFSFFVFSIFSYAMLPRRLTHFNMATFVLYRDAKRITMKEGDMEISKISKIFQVSLVIGVGMSRLADLISQLTGLN